jgi:hypothetical protein
MDTFIGEDELAIFEGWLRYQQVDPLQLSVEELAHWRQMFDDNEVKKASRAKVGLMSLQKLRAAGDRLYAVAVQEHGELLLARWVRHSRKGEFFVMIPTGDPSWDAHASYHLDGRLHHKSFDQVVLPRQLQRLDASFRGTVQLGVFSDFAPKGIGAVCDPNDFDGVVKVPSGMLGPRHGAVSVDLVEPGVEPIETPWRQIHDRVVFKNATPWIVITVGS